MAVSREAIFDSRVEWGPLPNFKSLKGGDRSERGDKNNKHIADKATTAEKPKGIFFHLFCLAIFYNHAMACICVKFRGESYTVFTLSNPIPIIDNFV